MTFFCDAGLSIYGNFLKIEKIITIKADKKNCPPLFLILPSIKTRIILECFVNRIMLPFKGYNK